MRWSVFLVAAMLAGCVGTDAGPESDGSASSTLDASGGDASLGPVGSLQGFVRDEELAPVPGANVALLKTTFQAETDEAGGFAILNLPVGEYTVVAQRLGYDSKAQKVQVIEGQTTWVNLTLLALATDEAYHVTLAYSTVMQCMLVTPAWVSTCSYPYTAVYLTARDHGVNLSNYGAPADVMQNRWRFNWSVEHDVKNVVSELSWKPNSDLAKIAWFVQCKPEYDPVLDSCPFWAEGRGESTITYAWEVPKAERAKDPGEKTWIMSAIWPYPGSGANAVGVYLDQKFEAFNTAFYGAEAPEDWSVFAPPS